MSCHPFLQLVLYRPNSSVTHSVWITRSHAGHSANTSISRVDVFLVSFYDILNACIHISVDVHVEWHGYSHYDAGDDKPGTISRYIDY